MENPHKEIPGKPLLTPEQVKEKLHRFNLTHDWSLFENIHPAQEILFLYPEVHRLPGVSMEDYKKGLIVQFGPLPEDKEIVDNAGS